MQLEYEISLEVQGKYFQVYQAEYDMNFEHLLKYRKFRRILREEFVLPEVIDRSHRIG